MTILSSSVRKRNAMTFSSGHGVKATVVGTYAVDKVTDSVHRCCLEHQQHCGGAVPVTSRQSVQDGRLAGELTNLQEN